MSWVFRHCTYSPGDWHSGPISVTLISIAMLWPPAIFVPLALNPTTRPLSSSTGLKAGPCLHCLGIAPATQSLRAVNFCQYISSFVLLRAQIVSSNPACATLPSIVCCRLRAGIFHPEACFCYAPTAFAAPIQCTAEPTTFRHIQPVSYLRTSTGPVTLKKLPSSHLCTCFLSSRRVFAARCPNGLLQ